MDELMLLTAQWANAVGPARDVAFNVLVDWMAKNPTLAQNIAKGGPGILTAAYEVHLLRIFAAGATARILQAQALPTMRMYLSRLALNFAAAPKVPTPATMGLIFIGSILLTGCSIKSDNEAYQAAMPSYNMYVVHYISLMAAAKKRFPNRNIPSPMEFEEWYQQNRT